MPSCAVSITVRYCRSLSISFFSRTVFSVISIEKPASRFLPPKLMGYFIEEYRWPLKDSSTSRILPSEVTTQSSWVIFAASSGGNSSIIVFPTICEPGIPIISLKFSLAFSTRLSDGLTSLIKVKIGEWSINNESIVLLF